jgi:hypothetical protein
LKKNQNLNYGNQIATRSKDLPNILPLDSDSYKKNLALRLKFESFIFVFVLRSCIVPADLHAGNSHWKKFQFAHEDGLMRCDSNLGDF